MPESIRVQLLRLKYDMIYRGLSREEAQRRFNEIVGKNL
jgi:hypothetical protein